MRMKLSNKIVLITGGTSGIGLEAAKRWCMELWLLKYAFGLPEIGNPDAVKAIEQEEIASNCGPDQAKECLPMATIPPAPVEHHFELIGATRPDRRSEI